jgi:hypothetical protein
MVHTRSDFWTPLVDHQHNFGGFDDGGNFGPNRNLQLLNTLPSDNGFDQIAADANTHLCCYYSEVDRLNNASQLIPR